VLLFRDPAGSLAISTLAGARDGISSAIAVRPIGASEVAVVEGGGRLAAVNLDSSAVAWVDLVGAADRLDSLADGLLVLNSAGTQPLLLLDIARSRTPYFVPPAAVLKPPPINRAHP
jgi:hypothetical protein